MQTKVDSLIITALELLLIFNLCCFMFHQYQSFSQRIIGMAARCCTENYWWYNKCPVLSNQCACDHHAVDSAMMTNMDSAMTNMDSPSRMWTASHIILLLLWTELTIMWATG